MTVAGSEAIAKIPTVEEEMSKFKGFSVQDGEVTDGKSTSAADARAEAEAAELHAGTVNGRSHKENQEAGTTSTERAAAAAKTAKVELSADEEEAALQEATDKKGAVLTDEEADEVVGKALSAKQSTVAKEARKKDVNSRMGELTRLRREAERREETTRRENDDLRRRLDALERGEKPATLTNGNKGGRTVSQDGKPDPTDTEKYQYGELDAKYIADLARFETLQAIEEREQGKTKEQKDQQDAAASVAFKEAVTAFEEAGLEQFDDFEEVVIATYNLDKTDPGFWPLSQTMAELIFESDHGPAIAYNLASDPKEARRIAALPLARQAAWFGVQEAKLSAGSAASSKANTDDGVTKPQAEAGTKRQLPQPRTGQARESKAPLPLTKLNGAGGNRVPSAATTDFAAFEAMATGGKR